MYELLVHAIPPRTILKTMTDYLVTRVDEALRPAIVEKAAFYELRTRNSAKAIFHLEAFVAAVMTMIKSVSSRRMSGHQGDRPIQTKLTRFILCLQQLYMDIEWDE